MSYNKKRWESMLFNYETTGRTDFREGEIKSIIKTEYKEKPVCLGIRPAPLKYLHTLTDWQRPIVPADLYVKPKEIVRTNPWHVQKKYKPLPDLEKEQVRNTRPRLVMTPAVSMDDIEDDKVRDLLLNEVYSTTAAKAMRDGIKCGPPVDLEAPEPKLPAPANPIKLAKLNAPYVSPEWRMDSVGWDSRQLRTYTNHTEQFWLARTPRCEVCKQTAARDAMKRLKLRPN